MPHIDEPIPYAIAASLDVEPNLGVDIYQEVKQRVTVTPRTGVRVHR